RCTLPAKMKCYSLPARVGPVVVDPKLRAVQYHVLSLEYRFNQGGRARQPLAKGAVTNGYAHRLGGRSIADPAAKTSTLMNHGHEVDPNCLRSIYGRAFNDFPSELNNQSRKRVISERGVAFSDLTRK